METTDIDALPDEILTNILGRQNITDIIRSCSVNKRFKRICSDRTIWIAKIREDFPWISQDIIGKLEKKTTSAVEIYRYLYGLRSLDGDLENEAIIKVDLGEDGMANTIFYLLTPRTHPGFDLAMRSHNHSEDMMQMKLEFLDLDNAIRFTIMEEVVEVVEGRSPFDQFNLIEAGETLGKSIYNVGSIYMSIMMSIYASLLYRDGTSINFLDMENAYRFDPLDLISDRDDFDNLSDEEREDFFEARSVGAVIEFNNIITTRNIPVSDDGIKDERYLIQMLHSLLVARRKYGIVLDPYVKYNLEMYLIEEVYKDDEWNGQRLKDADFWAYRVGGTTLYFRPCEYILKFNHLNTFSKLAYPILSLTANPENYPSEPERSELIKVETTGGVIEDWKYMRTLMGTMVSVVGLSPHVEVVSPLAERIIQLLNNMNDDNLLKNMDLYFILQDPNLFGEYMYPEKLTPNSKVIILGKI